MDEEFPHGPRNLEPEATSTPLLTSTSSRRIRSVENPDQRIRSTDVGVSGIYEVISEADLAFSIETHAEAVAVFQGRIFDEVVYGICLSIPGFSTLFVFVTLAAVISALVAGTMLHRLRAQREIAVSDCKSHKDVASNANGWLSYGLLRIRCADTDQCRIRKQQECTTNPVE